MSAKSLLMPPDVNLHWVRPQSIDLNLASILSESEKDKASQFAFEKDRRLYLAAHIFLRSILSKYSGVEPEKLVFKHNAFGKPSLAAESKLCFNLSHTTGMIVCAISDCLDIGVDVENHKRIVEMKHILHSSFSSKEAKDVLQQSPRLQQHKRFFTYWTLKEAYVKGVGGGLTIPLKLCNFQQTDQGWKILGRTQNRIKKTKWAFYNSTLGDEWVVSVAIDVGLFSANQALMVRITDSNSRESFRWSSTAFEASI